MTSHCSEIYPVILSGGSGSRLWPLSSSVKPKQFLSIVGDQTMIQDTIDRVSAVEGLMRPIIVCGSDHADIVQEQFAALDVQPSAILLEPEGRNTAAAIAIAAEWIAARHPDALMLVMPSDHVIADVPRFHAAIDTAVETARADYLVTFGIQPGHPETGYGYIAKGAPIPAIDGAYFVDQFREKPSFEAAQAYVESGRYYWNGGIFLFKASSYLKQLAILAPAIASASSQAMKAARQIGVFVRPDKDAFMACPDMSIDIAVMQETERAAVIPVDMGWSDVGSWDALWAISAQDEMRNACKGDVTHIDASGNLIYVDGGPPVAVVGVSASIIISTGHGVLVMPMSRAQDVKVIVERMKRRAVDQ